LKRRNPNGEIHKECPIITKRVSVFSYSGDSIALKIIAEDANAPTLSSDGFQAHLRGLVHRTFLSDHGSLLCRHLLAYRGGLYDVALGFR
jgi:hypothetical protein